MQEYIYTYIYLRSCFIAAKRLRLYLHETQSVNAPDIGNRAMDFAQRIFYSSQRIAFASFFIFNENISFQFFTKIQQKLCHFSLAIFSLSLHDIVFTSFWQFVFIFFFLLIHYAYCIHFEFEK